MADLTAQDITNTGLAPVFVAADVAGDTFTNTGREVVHVKNGSAASINVTLVGKNACEFGFLHDDVVAVPAGAESIIDPTPTRRFVDKTTKKTTINYSAVTSVTVAVYQK